ncbi:sulfotransferase [Salinimicrobium sp. GXAS 041]|uniref:sulfotransferase n=1 Tax=Salinimicrobium sp. GXAS 041 TaxID=3400806 RepID=UPI003C73A6E2
MAIKSFESFLYRLKKKITFFFKPSYRRKRREKIIFVLSTGRCGSTSITKMFNQNPRFIAFHEVIPELIGLSTKLAENPDSKDEIFSELKRIFRKKKWDGKKGQVVVHSDHRMWNLVEFLSDYFPNSSFIHLMRNPHDCVQSFLPRGWYTENDIKGEKNIFGKYRLQGDKIGAMSSKMWESYSRLEKCTWYWNYVNTYIENELKDIEEERVQVIKLENLQKEMNEKIGIKHDIESEFNFCNIITNQGSGIEGLFESEKVSMALRKFEAEFYSKYYSND